jgi:acyl-homoserine lactone acylase PvdQ
MIARVLAGAAAGEPGPPPWTRGNVIRTVRAALRTTWLRFGVEVGPNREKWTWGRLHPLEFRPFGLLRWARPAEPELGPHAYPGDRLTVAAGGYDWREPFAARAASTHRMAVDAAELDTLLVSLAPGQVEQPGHPNRADGVAPWLAGQPQLLVTSAVLVEARAVARLEIVPAEAGQEHER